MQTRLGSTQTAQTSAKGPTIVLSLHSPSAKSHILLPRLLLALKQIRVYAIQSRTGNGEKNFNSYF